MLTPPSCGTSSNVTSCDTCRANGCGWCSWNYTSGVCTTTSYNSSCKPFGIWFQNSCGVSTFTVYIEPSQTTVTELQNTLVKLLAAALSIQPNQLVATATSATNTNATNTNATNTNATNTSTTTSTWVPYHVKVTFADSVQPDTGTVASTLDTKVQQFDPTLVNSLSSQGVLLTPPPPNPSPSLSPSPSPSPASSNQADDNSLFSTPWLWVGIGCAAFVVVVIVVIVVLVKACSQSEYAALERF